MPSSKPLSAVFLDAGGTLFREVPSRARIYLEAARSRGLSVDEPRMREIMDRLLAEMPRREGGHFRYSEGWFACFGERLFCGALGLPRVELGPLQEGLFRRFADPATFRAYPGAVELLERLAARGLALGVISNWSERLPGVLEGLGLGRYLDVVLASAVEGCEKPEPEIFRRALERVGVDADRALHAGNDPELDVRGPAALGILPVLVAHGQTPRAGAQCPAARCVASLEELSRFVLERAR